MSLDYTALTRRQTEEEYRKLKADIMARGILTPVVYDEDGNLIDGHHRKSIADELKIPCPSTVVDFRARYGTPSAAEQAKRQAAISLNLCRKDFTREEKARLYAELAECGMSITEIARKANAPRKTVSDMLAEQGINSESIKRARDDKALALIRQGLSAKEVAAEVGVGVATVYRLQDSQNGETAEMRKQDSQNGGSAKMRKPKVNTRVYTGWLATIEKDLDALNDNEIPAELKTKIAELYSKVCTI